MRFALVCGGVLLALAPSSVEAVPIGNQIIAGRQHGTDGHGVLNLQSNHPIPEAGTIDSFSFYREPDPTASFQATYPGPYTFHALVVRPTGTPNQYSVVFDSGMIDPTSLAVGLQTIAVTPFEVEEGDLIGHWGRGISFNIPGVEGSPFFYNGGPSTPLPVGTFLAPSGTYPNGGSRTYGLAANFTALPEPGSILIWSVVSLLGVLFVVRQHRRKK